MRILIIDDSDALRRSMVRYLQTHGIDCVDVPTVEAGLKLMESEPFDVVSTDWHFADGASGTTVAPTLRGRNDQTPVAIHSGRIWTNKEIASALDEGADDVILRPLEAGEELVARFKALHRRARYLPTPRTLRVRGIELCMDTRTVSFRETRAVLTQGDALLLRLLMVHYGQIVSYAQLYSAIGYDHRPTGSHAVNEAVRRLRRKVSVLNDRLKLLTGVGYGLDGGSLEGSG